MLIKLPKCIIRSWRPSDAAAFLKHGSNRKIWSNLREDFPNGFDRSFAEGAVRNLGAATPQTWFAIDLNDAAIGMIGLRLASGPFRLSGELGYWIGESFWGQGIATDAVLGFTDYAMNQYQLRRIFAFVFEWNPSSMRVLEKCGYVKEGVLRQSLVKDGCLIDQVLYSHVTTKRPVSEPEGTFEESETPLVTALR